MADVIFDFEDNSVKILKETDNAIETVLLEVAAEIVSRTARNTRVDTGKLKGSWQANVSKTDDGFEAVIGSPEENAIWEEFGTGEHALKGNGRKGGWFYVDEEDNGHFTLGKKPSRAFFKAFSGFKNKAIERIQDVLKGL